MNSGCENFILPMYLQQNGCEVPKFDKLTYNKVLTKWIIIYKQAYHTFVLCQLKEKLLYRYQQTIVLISK